MKHRLLSLFALVFVLAVFIGSGIGGVLFPLLATQNAYAAASPEAAFNSTSNSATISAIEQLLKDNDSGASLNQTEVIIRGGIWGNGTLFNYVRSVDGGINHYGIQYSANYYCVNNKPQLAPGDSAEGNIKIEASVYVQLPNDYHNHATFTDWQAHVSHITFTPKQVNGTPLKNPQELSYDPASNSDNGPLHPGKDPGTITANGKNITAGCDITVANTSKPMPNLMYLKTPQSVKDAWAAALKSAGGAGDTPGTPSSANGGDTTPDSSVPSLSCKAGLNPLNWLICGIVSGMVSIIGDVDNLINSQLSVGTGGSSDNPNQIFCDSSTKADFQKSCNDYHVAWASFRDIALGMLVVVSLIVLIAQALGTEILDAYTIRKILPRLLIAALAITLSWQLMQFFVKLTNDLGLGIRHLIYYPFSRNLSDSVNLSGGNDWAISLVGATAITAMGIFGLLSFAATAALAVFIGFLILIIRQLVIIMLIILAPVALLMYILPNTQNTYKLWWESFSKALLMFPLIAGLIASGRVFAAVAAQNTDAAHGGNPVNALIAFAAYFAPYFALPLTFKFAGGALRQIGGFVNDRGRGTFDGLRRFRGGQVKQNAAALKSGQRFTGKSWIPGSTKAAGVFGEVSKGIGTGWTGRFGVGPRGTLARRSVDQTAAREAQQSESMKNNAGWNDHNRLLAAGFGDEKRGKEALVHHLMNGGDEGSEFLDEATAKARANQAARDVKNGGGFTKARGIAAFNNMARDGTAIRDVDDLAFLAARVGDGDRNNTYSFAADAASISRQAGRSDLAAAGTQIGNLALHQSDQMYNNRVPRLYTGNQTAERLSFEAHKSAFGGAVGFTVLGNDKGRSLRLTGGYLANVMNDTEGVYTHQDKIDAAVAMYSMKQEVALGNGKPNSRRAATEAMAPGDAAYEAFMNTELTGTTGEVIDEETIDGMTFPGDVVPGTNMRSEVARIASVRRAETMSEEQQAAQLAGQQQQQGQQQEQEQGQQQQQ